MKARGAARFAPPRLAPAPPPAAASAAASRCARAPAPTRPRLLLPGARAQAAGAAVKGGLEVVGAGVRALQSGYEAASPYIKQARRALWQPRLAPAARAAKGGCGARPALATCLHPRRARVVVPRAQGVDAVAPVVKEAVKATRDAAAPVVSKAVPLVQARPPGGGEGRQGGRARAAWRQGPPPAAAGGG